MNITSLLKKSVVRNVLVLASGAAVGQAIAVLSGPILTRLFDTSAFGLFATFTAITGSIGAVATLKYEQAIVLEPSDEAANDIFRLCCIVPAAIAVLSTIVFCGLEFVVTQPFWQDCMNLLVLLGGISIFSLGM